MYQVISHNQKREWNEVINLFRKKDIYCFQEYCSLYHLHGDGEPHLFFYKDGNGNMVCYPFIKRTIDLPFPNKELLEETFYDIITPYGYGGPIIEGRSKDIIIRFHEAFRHYCNEHNIISEFIRFNPLLKNHRDWEDVLDVIYDRKTVYVDLTRTEEEILSSYHKNHRRNINKARRNKLQFKVFQKEEAIEYIEDFYQLYTHTMDKLKAISYYYFSIKYLGALLTGLSNKSLIAAVFLEDRMISAALCMHEGDFLHYHLGCSDINFLNLGSNVFLFHNIVLWGKKRGFQAFHLGGGHVEGDSLFQFKQRFYPDGLLDFYIGRKVYNKKLYDSLVRSWEEFYSQKAVYHFFPAYRAKPLQIECVGNS